MYKTSVARWAEVPKRTVGPSNQNVFCEHKLRASCDVVFLNNILLVIIFMYTFSERTDIVKQKKKKKTYLQKVMTRKIIIQVCAF